MDASSRRSTERWGSRFGFILAVAGSAIGLGNIWRFPSSAAENGGGAFVALFLLVIVLVGVPGLMAELGLGRHTRRNAADAFLTVRPGSPWVVAGALALLASFLILSYYAVIAGWVLAYVFKAAAGALADPSVLTLRDRYTEFVAHPWQPLAWQAVFLALTAAVVIGGVRAGIERWSRILMPGLLILLGFLVIRVLSLDGAWDGVVWLFRPHWAEVTWTAVLRAMGQVFFSFGLGMGVLITYGSYLDRDEDIHRSAVYVAIADAAVALLAATIVIPALFAFGMPVEGGAGLLFVTLPAILGQVPFGAVLTTTFFVMVAVAALTSAISMLETLVAFIEQRSRISRRAASLIVSSAVFVAGVPSALAHGPHGVVISGQNVFALVDTLASDLLLPVSALLTACFVGWVWGVGPALRELREGAAPFPERLWSLSVRVVIPLTVGTILVTGLFGVR